MDQSLITVSKENDEKCTVYMESMCDTNTEKVVILQSYNHQYHKECFKKLIYSLNEEGQIHRCSTCHCETDN